VSDEPRPWRYRHRLSESSLPGTLVARGAVDIGAIHDCGHDPSLVRVLSAGDSAAVRVFKEAPGGREITLYHVRDGEPCLINMLCVFLGCPATASSVAEAPTHAVVVPAAAVRKWITTDELIRSYVFETMAARLTEVMTLAVEISVSRMDVRLAGLLLRLVSVHADETVSLTHDELAAELGTAREIVSRLLKEFERAGALRLARGHVTVVDQSRLIGLASPTTARV